MQKPRIGISGPDRGGWAAWLFTSWAIRRAGGRPVRITPSRGMPRVALDGLVVGGGADVEPARYQPAPREDPKLADVARSMRSPESWWHVAAGVALTPLVYLLRRLSSTRRVVDPQRDELELKLIDQAVRCELPILGICRGAQLLNVHAGGTLHQSLEDFYVERPNPWTILPRKQVSVQESSRLAQALGREQCRVNSLHRQAVRDLGRGFEPVAIEATGVIQGIERPHGPMRLGVQWHPELLPQKPEQRRLFSHLVQQAD